MELSSRWTSCELRRPTSQTTCSGGSRGGPTASRGKNDWKRVSGPEEQGGDKGESGGNISKSPKRRVEGEITSRDGLQLGATSALRSPCKGGESQSKLPRVGAPPHACPFPPSMVEPLLVRAALVGVCRTFALLLYV